MNEQQNWETSTVAQSLLPVFAQGRLLMARHATPQLESFNPAKKSHGTRPRRGPLFPRRFVTGSTSESPVARQLAAGGLSCHSTRKQTYSWQEGCTLPAVSISHRFQQSISSPHPQTSTRHHHTRTPVAIHPQRVPVVFHLFLLDRSRRQRTITEISFRTRQTTNIPPSTVLSGAAAWVLKGISQTVK